MQKRSHKKIPEQDLKAADRALEKYLTEFLNHRNHPSSEEILDLLFEKMKDNPTLIKKIGRFLKKEWDENKHHISVTLQDGELAIQVAGIYVFTQKLMK